MTQNILSAATLKSNNDTFIPDNVAGDVSPGDVRAQINNMVDSLRPTQVVFFNDTGVEIDKGKVINAAGVDGANNVLKGILADASDATLSSAVIGISSAAVPDQSLGVAVDRTALEDMNTSGLTAGGLTYLSDSSAGGLTTTRPRHPSTILIMGSVTKTDASTGILQILTARFNRRNGSRSYTFTSQGVPSGSYWKAGFYDWDTTDANLSQASLTVTHGVAGQTYAAHVGIVPSGPGIVDTGQVGLRVTGTLDSETGPQQAAQTQDITDDITTLTLNLMAETIGKFSGQVTLELYVVSGAPTAFSLDFNYGYNAYEDFANTDVTIASIECAWLAGANDASGFNIELFFHKATDWTYAATGFVPGDGTLAERLTDQAIDDALSSNDNGKWKRVDLNTFVDSSAAEGIIWRITTGANNTIQSMDLHITAFSEELT